MEGKKRTLVVVGGVAAGMSAASQVKRRAPEVEVIVLEKGYHVSYGACGMPYNVMDPQRNMDDLVVMTADQFERKRDIRMRLREEAVAISTGDRTVRVRRVDDGSFYDLPYTWLLLSTGARVIRPPIKGLDLEGVFALHVLEDMVQLKDYLKRDPRPRRAVIVGAGYVGMEMAEALAARGLQVEIVEMLPHILSRFEAEVREVVQGELKSHEVVVHTGQGVVELLGAHGRVREVRTTGGLIPADLVLLATGIRPNSELAKGAGIAIGCCGAIAINNRMETSAPGVYAAGDCAEVHHLVLGQQTYLPLGTTANKQGKIAGAIIAGEDAEFPGVVGSQVFKVFNLEVAATGINMQEAEGNGLEASKVAIKTRSRAHGYPNGKEIHVVVIFEKATGRLLGAQMVGGEGVSKRIDIFAAALHARWTVMQVSQLDLAYAPPFSPVWDPVLVAATQAAKMVGRAS